MLFLIVPIACFLIIWFSLDQAQKEGERVAKQKNKEAEEKAEQVKLLCTPFETMT